MAVEVGVNSYTSIQAADSYFEGRLYINEWEVADIPTREKALRSATSAIDRLRFRGVQLHPDQSLAFPRVTDTSPRYGDRLFIEPFVRREDGVIPTEVAEATCEEALALLQFGNSHRQRLQREGVTSFSLDGVSESYTKNSTMKLSSSEALGLLRPWMGGSVSVSGLDRSSGPRIKRWR